MRAWNIIKTTIIGIETIKIKTIKIIKIWLVPYKGSKVSVTADNRQAKKWSQSYSTIVFNCRKSGRFI